jgi:exopolyphosphatase/guanosine-5'-triphosphate,3'-diphosphate pyrophosphatase
MGLALTELEPMALRLYDGAVQRLGIVDLGSGTARLVVYVYEPGKQFRLVDEIRETVRLGEGLATQGRLTRNGMQRALSALKLYADFAQATELDELRVIATSASRDAENGAEFMREVSKLGLRVQVLSGEDEARYGVLAVANSFTLEEAWVMDLGGGSAQLSRMEGRQYQSGQAYPLGAVRLTELFLKSNPPKKSEVEDLERFVRREMKEVLAEVRQSPLPLVAMGGTVRNLAKLAQRRKDYPLDLVHGYFLSREALEEVVALLAQRTTEQRRQLEGLQADRADVIVAGALVYRTVLREGGLEGLWISGQGVREGVFYREFLPAPHLLSDVRGFYVRNLFARYPQDYGHTARVRHFCRLLFGLLAPLHGYGQAEEQLLDEAALLHDIGMSVGYYDHHKHGEYLVMSGAIPGLTHREQVLLGLLVRYHRKGEPRPGAYKSVLQDGDHKRLLRLATILRISEYLERSRAGRVEGLEVHLSSKQVRLTLLAQEEPWVELAETRKQARLFQQAFGLELLVEWSP